VNVGTEMFLEVYDGKCSRWHTVHSQRGISTRAADATLAAGGTLTLDVV